jgi:hypothetical protein
MFFISPIMHKLQKKYIYNAKLAYLVSLLTHKYDQKFSVVEQLTAIPFILAPRTVLISITHMALINAVLLSTVDHACNQTSTTLDHTTNGMYTQCNEKH